MPVGTYRRATARSASINVMLRDWGGGRAGYSLLLSARTRIRRIDWSTAWAWCRPAGSFTSISHRAPLRRVICHRGSGGLRYPTTQAKPLSLLGCRCDDFFCVEDRQDGGDPDRIRRSGPRIPPLWLEYMRNHARARTME